jgi:hypothetical protein
MTMIILDNPSECIDFIFFILISGRSFSHIVELIGHWMSQTDYQYFVENIKSIQSIKPKEQYSRIYNLYRNHDRKYFDRKMTNFQENVIRILNNFENLSTDPFEISMAKFIDRVKIDLSVELNTVYQRLRYFPQERNLLYRTYPDHPYVKLIKMIHIHYLDDKRIVNINAMEILHFFNKVDANVLIDAVATRSELFEFMYERYLGTVANNVAPKYNTKHNYFPFKVFSPILFLMEHLSNQ